MSFSTDLDAATGHASDASLDTIKAACVVFRDAINDNKPSGAHGVTITSLSEGKLISLMANLASEFK